MRAQKLLDKYKEQHRYFSYLVALAEAPYRKFENDNEDAIARKNALPVHIQEEIEKVFEKHGEALTPKQRKAIWEHCERMEAGGTSDIEWPRLIHNRFMSNAPDEVKKKLSESDLAVGLLQDARFRGSVLQVPNNDNGWVIALYEGYSIIIYSFARTLASTFTMSPNDSSEETRPILTSEDAVTSLFGLLRHHMFVGAPIQDREPVTSPHALLAYRLTDMAEKFVYSHEIAHILLDHDLRSGRYSLATTTENSSVDETSVQDEIDADVQGWYLMLHVLLPSDGILSPTDLQMAYAGTRLFLRILQLLEHVENISPSGTHPPAAKRLESIRIAAKNIATEHSIPFEMIQSIDNAMQVAMTKLEQGFPPLPWKSPIDELLDDVVAISSKHGLSSAHGKNARLTAVHKILQLLSFGSPRKLCKELGNTMGKAQLELEALGIDLTIERSHNSPPYKPEVIKTALPAFARFLVIAALDLAYLPDQISQQINNERERYLGEHKHVKK